MERAVVPMALLEQRVSALVLRARILELAIHQPDGWNAFCGGLNLRPEIVLSESGVTFVINIPSGVVADKVLLEFGCETMAVLAVDAVGEVRVEYTLDIHPGRP